MIRKVVCRFEDNYVAVFRDDDRDTAPSITLDVDEAVDLAAKIEGEVQRAAIAFMRARVKR